MFRRVLLLSTLALAMAPPLRADDVNVSPVMVDFGKVKIGTTVTVRVTFTNLTNQQLQVGGGGGVATPFAASSGTCGSGALAAASSCYLTYSFRPTNNDETLFEDDTSVSVTGGSSPEYLTLSFRGRGTGNLADVAWTDIDFGDWFVGEQAPVRLRVVNTHGAGLNFAGGGFNTSNGFGAIGCGLGSGPLPAGEVCDLTYTFQPPATGFRENNTNFSLTTDDPPYVSQYFSLHVQGMGIATVPLVGITPVDVDFGDVTIGRRPEVPVDYTNYDAGTVNVSGGGFNDNDGAFYAVGSGLDPCVSSSIASGDTCTVNYSFRPIEERDFAASTSLGFSKTGGYQSSPLSFTGHGIGTLALVSPVVIDFGTVAPGTNMTVPVMVTNTSEAPLTNFIGGGVLSPFSKTSDTCGASLAVDASCQFNYRFTANSADPASAQTLLSFTNSSGIQPSVQIQLYANPEPGATGLDACVLLALAMLRRRAGSRSVRAELPVGRGRAAERAPLRR